MALDDLGAGYGSLMRLRRLPFDLVKIDQGLVRGINHEDRRSLPLVEALVQMARKLSIPVAIEGLETEDMIFLAAQVGADYGQGYAIARPMPPDELPSWIATHDRAVLRFAEAS